MVELTPEVWALIAGAVVVLAGGTAWLIRRSRPALIEEAEALPELEDAGAAMPEPPGLTRRFFEGLTRSREALARGLARATGSGGMDEQALTELEDALIGADVGVHTATAIVDALRKETDPEALRPRLREELLKRLPADAALATTTEAPLVILVVGVNGSGKTTTIGKLASRYTREGKKVVLAAGDTFRAGAIEQLKVWGDRAGCQVVAHQEGADPAAVIFDGIEAAKARKADVLICDTAGRLQAQKVLMDELGKVVRVMRRAMPEAPHEVILVLDATIGQNALAQAEVFRDVVGVTGVALTKLDGTARGGVVVAVGERLGLPVKLVGLGEGVDDLRNFDRIAFVDAMVGPGD